MKDINSKIAIIIKTTPERKSILWLLNSIELSLKDISYRIYLADEEVIDDWKYDLYNKLIEKGHYVKIWNSSVSVTKARNDLIDHLENEDYVLRVDDDFELGGEYNIHSLLTILESNNDIDFCCDIERQIGEGKNIPSGNIRIESGKIDLHSKTKPVIKIIDDADWNFEISKGVRYAKADFMRNLILLKRKCVRTVKWNENLFFAGEHADFFLSLKKEGFQGAFTPDSIHLHRDDLKYSTVDSQKESLRRKADREEIRNSEFIRKWGGEPIKKRGFISDNFRLLKRKIKKLNKWK